MTIVNFDVVVIGAGSAGCAVAGRLAADGGLQVLLLEAGGGNRHPLITAPIAWPIASVDPRFGWGYLAEPDPATGERAIDLPRGRLLGGTSSINGMMYSRGHAADYDAWAAQGLDGWSYSDVLPYFRKSESNWRGENLWHGGNGPVSVVANGRNHAVYPAMMEAAAALGHAENPDFNGAEQEGFGMADFTVARARRESAATAYLDLPGARNRLTVRSDVRVTRIVIEGGRATGVEFAEGGVSGRVGCGEVVVSAGVFNTPQLLMLAGIGAAGDLRRHGIAVAADLPATGRNLQDHPMVMSAFAAARPIGFEQNLRLDRAAAAALQWMLGRDGLLSDAPLSVQGYVRCLATSDRPDMQFQVSHGSPASRPWFPGWRKPAPDVFGVAALQLAPDARGSVTLRSADPFAAPSIRLNLLQTEQDRIFAREMFLFIRRFFAAEPLREFVAAEVFPGPDVSDNDAIDQFVKNTIVTGAHGAGSCAMGTDPANSVVDARLKVHGIEGLRVADASIMPTIVRGNTSAPSMVIGEKAADLILGRTAQSLSTISGATGAAHSREQAA